MGGAARGRRCAVAALSGVLLLAACGDDGGRGGTAAPTPGPTTVVEPPPSAFPGRSFATATPEEHGLTSAAMREVDRYAASIGSNCVTVVRDGVLVHERYWNGTDAQTRKEVFSVTKSITSFLVGIAQDQGLLDIDEPASTYIPEWRGTPSEEVTIRNLLSNDSGRQHDRVTDYLGLVLTGGDITAYALGLEQQFEPGEQWYYNNAGVQALEAVLEAATGQPVQDFARQHLFEPIGMTSVLQADEAGNALLFLGAIASCQDLARFGLLALNEGRWGDQQVVSAEYVREAVSPSQELNTAYGFLWWLNSDGRRLSSASGQGANQRAEQVIDDGSRPWPHAPPDTFAAQGLAGQLVIVVPSERLVITRLGRGPGASVDWLVHLALGGSPA